MTLEGYEEYEPRVGTILKGFADLHVSKKFSDLKVRLGDRTWDVHKVTVCMRSSFFEATENVVTLHEDQPEVIDQMIEYMYKNDYKDDDSDIDPRVFNVRMVAVAEKYFVDNLAQVAIGKVAEQVNEGMSSSGWADAIEVAYATTADSNHELRDTLFGFVISRAGSLLDPDDLEHTDFRAMTERTPRFSLALAQRLADLQRRQSSLSTYRCPGSDCNVAFQTWMEAGHNLSWDCRECGESAAHNYQIWQAYRVDLIVNEPVAFQSGNHYGLPW
ncbi:hypothetical protein LTR42_000049 [Elasticomyces elasticus]|nr:hypothetical protein LTR42_000049 [Elasticomyces elasticus]